MNEWVNVRMFACMCVCVWTCFIHTVSCLRLICLSASHIHQNANIWQSPSKETQNIRYIPFLFFSHTHFSANFSSYFSHTTSNWWFSGIHFIIAIRLPLFPSCHIVVISMFSFLLITPHSDSVLQTLYIFLYTKYRAARRIDCNKWCYCCCFFPHFSSIFIRVDFTIPQMMKNDRHFRRQKFRWKTHVYEPLALILFIFAHFILVMTRFLDNFFLN